MNESQDPTPVTVRVLLPLALQEAYSYRVPPGMQVAVGDYVRVPLGPRQMIGVVWSVNCDGLSEPSRLRDILQRFDMPAMPQLHRRFVDWLAGYYLEQPGSVLRMSLRAPGVFEPVHEKLAYRAGRVLPDRMTPQRQRVLDVAGEGMAMRAGDLADAAGVGVSVVKGLADLGALETVALPPYSPFAPPDPAGGGVKLSRSQAKAATALRQAVTARDFSVCLLDGVTGSGKTEVYFEAMAAALTAGRQVLLLLPEIALTGQFITRVEKRFGVSPAEWHSGVRPRERERVWQAVARGEAMIVVGARSALFLPWRKPGLFVVDEEHESAFKQDDGVNYHARDMAVVYGSLGRFPVVLSSATPSLESLVNAERGRYRHVRLDNRHGRAELPEIDLVDMRAQSPEAGRWLSPPLCAAVDEALASGAQALLFLNRRGYAPLTLCRACGHRLECPDCSSWLVEHRFRRQLVCHHCGHAEPVPQHCPACQAEHSLVPCGPGVERLAEEAQQRFSDARIAILSSDLQRGAALKDVLRDIAKGRYNLIIGTQLVAKGHHFPELTFAGVVDADLALETTDPRAGERTWQLLAQVAGRAGRGDKPGRALIQTYMPDHPLMTALKSGDREGFLDHEKRIRQNADLPPYGLLAAVIVSGKDARESELFARRLATLRPRSEAVQVLGPATAPLAVVRGRYRWRFLIRAGRKTDVQAYLRQWLDGVKLRGSLRMDIDVDPYSFM